MTPDVRTMPARVQSALESAPFHHYRLDDETLWTEFHRTGTGYLLRFPDLADFTISLDGTSVEVFPCATTDTTTLEHLYANQVQPLALSRQEIPTFHASVVAIPEGAIAFLGKTGMGKSTLAASFALDRMPFLADDALLIEEFSGHCKVQPSHDSLRLWDDSADALLDPDHPRAARISYSGKARMLASDALAHSTTSQTLIGAFVLQEDQAKAVDIRPLSGSARHMAWIHNSFLLDVTDAELLRHHFEWTNRIANKVPTWSLDYPRDYGMLSKLRRAICRYAAKRGALYES